MLHSIGNAAVPCFAVQGRVVSFKNAIIILTSNLGSAEIFNAAYKQKKEGGQVAGKWLSLVPMQHWHHCIQTTLVHVWDPQLPELSLIFSQNATLVSVCCLMWLCSCRCS